MAELICQICGEAYQWKDSTPPPGICGDCYLRSAGRASVEAPGVKAHPAAGAPTSFGMALPVLGAVLGVIVAYLLRPSVFLVGQLPFEVVITGGSQLTGMDKILVSAAQQSLAMMLAGAIIGAIGGLVLQKFRAVPVKSESGAAHTDDLKRRSRRPPESGRDTPASAKSPRSTARRPQPQIVTNRGVLDMLRANIGDSLVIETIQNSNCDFDLGPDDLVELKSEGVSDAILSAMLQHHRDRAETE